MENNLLETWKPLMTIHKMVICHVNNSLLPSKTG
jgi:hypothetical protein